MPSSSCSVHQAKRPYAGTHSQPHLQSSITSYFHTPSTAAPPSTRYDSSPLPLGAPPLPAAVQASLLHVGMRIRKSVPEGYKTGAPFTLFSEPAPPAPRTTLGGPRSELTPFSGFSRAPVGLGPGLTHQQQRHIAPQQAYPLFQQPPKVPARSPPKRRLSTSAAAPPHLSRRGDEPLSPKSKPANRPLAHPRTRKMMLRAAAAVAAAEVESGEGQENDAMALDFEDAEFLDYGALGAEEEVVMGGF